MKQKKKLNETNIHTLTEWISLLFEKEEEKITCDWKRFANKWDNPCQFFLLLQISELKFKTTTTAVATQMAASVVQDRSALKRVVISNKCVLLTFLRLKSWLTDFLFRSLFVSLASLLEHLCSPQFHFCK